MASINLPASSPKTAAARRTGITLAFGLGIGLLLLLIAGIAGTGYFSLVLVREAENTIQQSTEIERLILAMDRGMEKARRLHGDFFLHYPRIGFAMAHEMYAQPSVREVAMVIAASDALAAKLESAGVSDSFKKSRIDLNLYLSLAKRFAETSIQAVELVTQLAAPDRGLNAQLDAMFATLSEATAGMPELNRHLPGIMIFTQKYRLHRERADMQSAFNLVFRLQQELAAVPGLADDNRAGIARQLDRFSATGQEIVKVDGIIKSQFNDFALQAASAAPAAEALARLARQEVARSREKINATYRRAFITIPLITLAGLLAAVIIAVRLHNRITRRIVRLTGVAENMQRGNAGAVAEESGFDELSQLGGAFNAMAARISGLVSSLEQKVEQRTADLAASERRFRQLFENSSCGVAVYEAVDDGGDFIFKDVNRAAAEIEGVARGGLIEHRLTEVFPGAVECGLLAMLRQVWRTGEPASQPARRYADGRRNRWREHSVYRLPSGEVVAIYRDLTPLMQAHEDREAMEERLRRARKMEAIGLLAGGVAHDLNNILAGIVGYPQLILMRLPPDSPLREAVVAIKESGERAAAVVADLLTVARGVASQKSASSLNDIVQQYLRSPECRRLREEHPAVSCVSELADDLRAINCSPIHIRKCLMNLVTNAMEAIEGDGVVAVSTRNQRVDAEMAVKLGLEEGDHVALTVADTGGGISEEALEHIFEPFYTRKILGRSGTGLGLAVVWNSVRDHCGAVSVTSSNEGTVFELYFPALPAAEPEKGATVENEAERPRGAGEKILIVDDETQLRDIATRMLDALGYAPVSVSSGEKGVEYLKEHEVDLVLLDMVMDPGINGRETYERMLAIRPGQKALIITGYSESEDVARSIQLGASGFMRKPYNMEELSRRVRAALDG